MERIEFIMSLDVPYVMLTQTMRELIERFDMSYHGCSAGIERHPIPMSFENLRDDFFDICIHYAETIPHFSDSNIYQSLGDDSSDELLISIIRDSSVEDFKQYIGECDYFDYKHPDYPIFADKLASACADVCYWMDRMTLLNLMHFPASKHYFDLHGTLIPYIDNLQVRRIPNRPDALLTVFIGYD